MPSSDFCKAGNLEYSMILFSFLNANVDSDNFLKYADQLKHLDHISTYSVSEGIL